MTVVWRRKAGCGSRPAQSFVSPAECVAEVTDDVRFTGGRLVQTPRQELLGWLAGYGLRPE